MQNIISITDMRDTFFEEIFNYCKKKNDLFIVSIDYGSPFLDKFRKRFKNQFIIKQSTLRNSFSFYANSKSSLSILFFACWLNLSIK
jgi:type II restriction/modification system DNA methylase subunit YeeA